MGEYKMKKLILIFGMMLSLNAHATGGFWCEYKNESVNFVLNGVTTRSFESDIVDAGAELSGQMGDDGLVLNAEQKFVKSDVRQYWNSGDEFRIVLYAETDTKNTTVRISTKAEPDGVAFNGTISISQYSSEGGWSIDDAPVSCSLE